ncbi:MAG: AAA family ATPase [Kiritimatiellia bacterium]|jgi:cytidylate kinase
MKETDKLVITISRQIGSGGAYIGRLLAKRLDMFYADRAIIRGAAEKLSVNDKAVAEREESVPGFWSSFVNATCLYPDLYVPPVMLAPSDYELFMAESEVIRRLAAERSVVIIGRLGFDVLKDHPARISVFLHASLDFRIERYARLYEVSAKEAKKAVVKNDRQRKRYCRMFASVDPCNATNYDLSIDTERIGSLEKAAELILKYIESVKGAEAKVQG